MKTVSTLIISLFMLISGSIFAQETKLYDFSNFIGTWKYETENEIFIIKIKEVTYVSTIGRTPSPMHFLVGGWKYVKDGITQYDCINQVDKDDYDKRWGCKGELRFYNWPTGNSTLNVSLGELKIMHTDPINVAIEENEDGEVVHWSADSGYSTLKRIPSNPNQLLFHIQPTDPLGGEFYKKDENGIITRQPYYKYDKNVKYFTVPADMTLTKVE
ncbi:MAG: hypothetical protein E7122_05880 [Bacteroidales bacterium]|nr:hypothetical protein [Bacteroidales bacterium]